jgi:hypothetical protein
MKTGLCRTSAAVAGFVAATASGKADRIELSGLTAISSQEDRISTTQTDGFSLSQTGTGAFEDVGTAKLIQPGPPSIGSRAMPTILLLATPERSSSLKVSHFQITTLTP